MIICTVRKKYCSSALLEKGLLIRTLEKGLLIYTVRNKDCSSALLEIRLLNCTARKRPALSALLEKGLLICTVRKREIIIFNVVMRLISFKNWLLKHSLVQFYQYPAFQYS